jgi:hypothetical protein
MPVYVVKVYLAHVDALETGRGLAPYVGDEWVQKYAGFPGGIYFNVYDPTHLARLTGQPIRFTSDPPVLRNRRPVPRAATAGGSGAG